MSRSWRKYPRYSRNDQYYKRLSSKAARKADLQDGGQYKKVGYPYEICDYNATLLTEAEQKRMADRFGIRELWKGYSK